MLRFLIALSLVFTSSSSFAVVLRPSACQVFDAVGAAANRTSSAIDMQIYSEVSLHCSWTGLTGSINGTVKFQVSSFPTAINFVDKSGATFNIVGASGTDVINVTAAPEVWYQAVYTHGSIAAGSLTCYCTAKGF